MPTPLALLTHPTSLAIFVMIAALMAYETLRPARPLPKIEGWTVRATLSFVVYFFLSSYTPLLWDEALAAHRLVDLTGWGTWGGALAAVLVYEAFVYAWHRAMHRSNVLWRVFHQMHHSAERIDTVGAFYFSPFDMLGWTVLGSLAMVWCLGITPRAATVALLFTTFLGLLQHANIATPRWLGYIVQRPESHAIHHARGLHRSNYSDLPIFDILFGTFENPAGYEHEAGFHDGASGRVLEMLTFCDVSEPASTSMIAQRPQS